MRRRARLTSGGSQWLRDSWQTTFILREPRLLIPMSTVLSALLSAHTVSIPSISKVQATSLRRTRNRKWNFMVGRKTEKKRYARCLAKLTQLMGLVRHRRLAEQAAEINQLLRGYYAYYGMGGNLRTLHRLHRTCERCWRRMLSSRSQRGNVTWEAFQKIIESFPLCRPRLYVPYSRMKSLAVL